MSPVRRIVALVNTTIVTITPAAAHCFCYYRTGSCLLIKPGRTFLNIDILQLGLQCYGHLCHVRGYLFLRVSKPASRKVVRLIEHVLELELRPQITYLAPNLGVLVYAYQVPYNKMSFYISKNLHFV
jgi:hypothetical protein